MKKFTLALFLFAICSSSFNVFAQTTNPGSSEDWVGMMRDPKVNIHEVQNAFNKWYEKKDHDKDTAFGANETDDESYELFKRWEWYNLPRADANGNRPDLNKVGAEYSEYLKHSDAHSPHAPVHPTLSTANWVYSGNTTVPSNSPDGSGFGGNGRVNRVRTMPGNTNTIFACTASGGLWETTNGGTSWSTKTDQLGDLTTSDIAINPSKTNVMYLATGDGDGIQSIYPDPATIGVLKSYDGGNTWNATTLAYTLATSGANYYSVNEILIDPLDTAVILAATTFGIYRSANSGATWTLATGTGSGDATWFHSMEFEPSHPSIVYASSSNVISGIGGNFYKSTNNGISWTNITSGLPANTAAEGFAIAVSAADSNAVFVLATNQSTYDYNGLYVSTNDGVSFTKKSGGSVPNVLGRAQNGNDYGVGQGWYDLTLAVSQTNIDSIWVGGINIWFSSNEGVNWTLNSDWFNTGAPYVHADIHDIQFIPGTSSKGYLVGCDGGVFKTTNSGTNWTNLSNNLENSEQYCVSAAATTPSLVITGWQDNGTNVSSSPWGQVFGGDGTDCFIDWSNPAIMYAETPGAPTFMRSTNSGNSWSNIVGSITESGQWVTPWLQDPKTSTTLYCGINNVWKTVNSGTSWSKISSWGGSGIISALVVDSANTNYIYAAQSNVIEVTANGGTSWTNITSGLAGATISGIAVSAKTPSHVWVVLSGYSSGNHVFASTNSGSTWTNITSGLPNLPVNCIVSESGSPNGIFVGTDQGVYYHDTVTNSWQFYNTNLPLVMVANLKIWQPTIKPTAYFKAAPLSVCAGSSVQFTDTSHNSQGATLIAATYGRGTWETQISAEVLSYNWTFTGGTPSTSTSQSPLVLYSTPGNYPVTLIVTNAVGSSTVTKSGYITVNANPTVTANITAEVSCNGGSNGSLSASPSGGASPYTYLWSAGGTSSTKTGLSIGTYTITVNDNNGCTGTGSATITQPLALSTTASVTANVNCNGGSTGNATASPSNGTGPYTYSWSNGTSTVSTVNPTGATLSAGGYTVTVQDNCGASQTAAVNITQPTLLSANVSITSNVLCNAGNTGSAQSAPAGGIPPYTYSWSSGETTSSINGKTANTYTLTVKDNNGCNATGSITITQPASALAPNTSVTSNVSCFGNNNGSAQSAPSGGTSPFTYSWSSGEHTSTISTKSAGTYTLTVQDNNGCSATGTVTITQPASSILTNATVTTNVTCFGNNSGSAQSAPSGGTSPYTYTWSSGEHTSSISAKSAATYTLTVQDNNGCSTTGSVTITQPASSVAANATVTSNVSCFGNSSGSAQSAPGGGVSPYTYSWSSGEHSSSITAKSSDTYTLTVQDNNGCSSTGTVTITQPASALTATTSVVANVNCIGNNSGSAQSVPGGGTSPYTYTWSSGEYTSSISGKSAATYTLTIQDNNGCSTTGSATITQPMALATTATVIANVSCSGSGNAGANPTGGTVPYTYSWSNGTSTVSTSNPTGNVLPVGTYTVTVRDNCSASATAKVTITQSNPVVANWWSIYNVACNGGNTGKVISTVYGGTPPYTYLWSNGSTTGTASGLSANTNYTLTVTDKNGCTGTNSITLTQPALPLSETTTFISNSSCYTVPNGSARANPAGGTSPYTYAWTPKGGSLQTSVTLPGGTDECKVTDAHGCTASATVSITSPAVIFATFTKTLPFCNGNSNGSLIASGTGGSGNYTNYVWAPYGGSSSTATGLSAQTYTVTVTDNTGCTGTAPSVLGQPAVIAVSIPTFTCVAGGKGTVIANASGGTAAYNYTWSNGTTTTGTSLKNITLPNGSYTVTVEDKHDCPTATASVIISGCPEELKSEAVQTADSSKETNITVYPNPTTGQFIVEWLAPSTRGWSVEIYNILGQNVYSQSTIHQPQSTINISNQPNGIYLIRILDKDGNLVGMKKVVKIN